MPKLIHPDFIVGHVMRLGVHDFYVNLILSSQPPELATTKVELDDLALNLNCIGSPVEVGNEVELRMVAQQDYQFLRPMKLIGSPHHHVLAALQHNNTCY
jgi:hypothetical protein